MTVSIPPHESSQISQYFRWSVVQDLCCLPAKDTFEMLSNDCVSQTPEKILHAVVIVLLRDSLGEN